MAVAPRRLTLRPGPWIVGLCLSACASTHAPPAPGPARAEAAPGSTPDASYDWHGLVIAPFGMLLKESPLALHEVLLFDDTAHPGEVDNKDCHAIERPPPRFVGRVPDEYLLCFSHDRLNRIEAAADLPADESAAVFARACALWLKGSPMPAAPSRCEGRDGTVSFTAHLGSEAGDAPNRLSISLIDSADPVR